MKTKIVLDTTPSELLTARAERGSSGTPGLTRPTVSIHGSLNSTDVVEMLREVAEFGRLIDDRRIRFAQLTPLLLESGAIRWRVQPPVTSADGKKCETEDPFLFRPREAFWRNFARYANTFGDVSGLSGGFLSSAAEGHAPAVLPLLQSLTERVASGRLRKRSRGSPYLMLRTLRADPAGKWSREREGRALLHDGYRDDLSHRWVSERIAELSPTGEICDYLFDGELLRGYVVVPEALRAESPEICQQFRGGILFFSGEVGNRRAGCAPFVWRRGLLILVGRIWGVTHSTAADLGRLRRELSDEIHRQLPLISVAIRRLVQARELLVPKGPRAAERLLVLARKELPVFTGGEMRNWLNGVLTEQKLFPNIPLSVDTVQSGLSRAARVVGDVSRRLTLEYLAFRLLNLPWTDMFAKLGTVSDVELDETFPGIERDLKTKRL